jgi:hypothetical protein
MSIHYVIVRVKEMLPSSLPLLCVQVLGAFAKLSNAIISFVMSVRLLVPPSVRPHGITQLPLEGFHGILYFIIFSKICRQISSFIEI